MKIRVKGKVLQIVPWEDRNEYVLGKFEFGDVPKDLIIIGKDFDQRPFLQQLFHRLTIKYDDWLLEHGIEITVERPHRFEVGKVVDVEIDIDVSE